MEASGIFRFFSPCAILGSGNRFARACRRATAAIDAGVGVDAEVRTVGAFADRFDRALGLARTAGNALFRIDFVSHYFTPCLKFFLATSQ
jgi:hypothetical protein